MFPFFTLSDTLIVYTFWLTLTIAFFLFLWMLKKLSLRFSYDFLLFRQNIIWFFLSVFVFSRLFYVVFKWNDLKYIKDPVEFFIMSDYNFSLFWALFWFFLILFINVKLGKESILKYLDGVVLSFFFVLFIGYIGSFLWGQVYGRETHIWIEILYTNPFTPVPFQVPIFPLPIVYAILFFIIFSVLYILSLYIHIRWFLWYIGLIAFSSILLIFEFFSWKFDILKVNVPFLNLNQVFAIVLLVICINGLRKLVLENSKGSNILS